MTHDLPTNRAPARRGTPQLTAWPGIFLLWLLALLLTACPPTFEPRHAPSGRLAFVGADGNVYVTAPGVPGSIQVTHDATAPAEGEGLSYHRIAWSPDGFLAFAAVERTCVFL